MFLFPCVCSKLSAYSTLNALNLHAVICESSDDFTIKSSFMISSLSLRLTNFRERNICFCQFSVDSIVFSVVLGISRSIILWMFGGSLRDFIYFSTPDLRVVPSVRFCPLNQANSCGEMDLMLWGRESQLPACQVSWICLGDLVGKEMGLARQPAFLHHLQRSVKVIFATDIWQKSPVHLECWLTGRIRMIHKWGESKEFQLGPQFGTKKSKKVYVWRKQAGERKNRGKQATTV